MKGNKKILVIAILLLLISVGFTTYAIYRSEKTASGTVRLAAWHVEIDGTDIDDTTVATIPLTLNDVEWTTNPGKAGTIAPGATGTITIPVDATGSQVDVIVGATIGTITGLPDGMTVTLEENSTTIAYAASEMTGEIVLNVAWTGTTADSTAKDTTDKTAAGSTLTIPVTLTARQKVAGE